MSHTFHPQRSGAKEEECFSIDSEGGKLGRDATTDRDEQTTHGWLDQLDGERIQQIFETVPGGEANVQELLPLSPLQEGMLFHRVLNEQRDTYVLSTLFEIDTRGALAALIEGLQHVINRHDVLRTAVLWQKLARPVQVVYRQVVLPVQELASRPELDALDELKQHLRPERAMLNLTQAPLARLLVAQDARSGRLFALLQAHHLICDHQSLQSMVAETLACVSGQTHELPPREPYRQYLQQALSPDRSQRAERFFQQKLATLAEPTAPFGLLDVHGDGSRLHYATQRMSSVLAQQVRVQASQAGVSVARLFHAAWAVVVARTSGRDDIVFGTVVLAQAQRTGQQRTLGMAVNTLPLRLQLAGITAEGLIKQTHRELAALVEHEHAPLTLAQACSGLTRGTPLFTSLLNFRRSQTQEEMPQTGVRVLERAEAWSNYPVAMIVDDSGEDFVLIAQCDRPINPQRLIAYLHTAMTSLVQALELAPSTPALALAILPGDERRVLLEDFNATQTEYPRATPIHELFEERVARTPHAVAVVEGEQEISYQALNSRANQLARHLKAEGVRVSENVALLMPRGLDLVIAQLAVLKCGGAYVPIDPDAPKARQRFMIEDCGARKVVGSNATRPINLPSAVTWMALQSSAQSIARQSTENLGTLVDATSVAYVMYTSGSTGAPKGVLVPHHAVNKLVINNGYAQIQSADRIGLCSNPTFDAATFEVWIALLNGARVIVIPSATVLESSAFVQALLHHRVSVMLMTAGLFNQSADVLAPALKNLRYLLVGGDVVDPVAVERVLAHCAPQHLLNAYGPTECTVLATTHRISHITDAAASLPIGRPLANTRIYILDGAGEPVPIGAVGEIHIGGEGVALGYLNREELTAQRFLPDRFVQGGRLYKTGDLGRWREDGVIEFMGRNDSQVKIRGFRIEPGEIEAHLARYPNVREAAVIARSTLHGGEKQLVAYITLRNAERSVELEKLREYLKEHLPQYMIPSALMTLSALPLTPNGKLDRKALPEPHQSAYSRGDYQPPRSVTEQTLAQIWQSLLGVSGVGRDDDFFELGGHSLLAMQLAARIQSTFSIEIPVKALFHYSSLRALAEHLEQGRRTRLIDAITGGGVGTRELLQTVATLSEHEVQHLINKLRTEGAAR